MSRKSIIVCAFAIFMLASIILGCGDDNPTSPGSNDTGTIVIDQTPDVLLGAGWLLTGPHNQLGSGDMTLTEVPVGDYTLTWTDVDGYDTPSPDTQALTAEGTANFNGTYIFQGPPPNFVLISGGSFSMGSPSDEYGHGSDETQHEVTLTTSFHMFNTEITNRQYADLAQWAYDHDPPLVTATNYSLLDALDGSTEELLDLDDPDCEISFSGGMFTVNTEIENRPVQEVTWYGSVAYCDWLSLQAGLARAYDHSGWQCNGHEPYSAQGYRLPTEAEWEYACRAETETPFNTGDCLDAGTEANYDGNYPYTGCPSGSYEGGTVPVSSYPPNTWGLYDMHGNLWEWCNDWFGSYGGDETDPTGPATGAVRVLRGGGWGSFARNCRSANRGNVYPAGSYDFGFRPVKSTD